MTSYHPLEVFYGVALHIIICQLPFMRVSAIHAPHGAIHEPQGSIHEISNFNSRRRQFIEFALQTHYNTIKHLFQSFLPITDTFTI